MQRRPDFNSPNCSYVRSYVFLGFFEPIAAEHNVAVHEDEPLRFYCCDAFLSSGSPGPLVKYENNVTMFLIEAFKDCQGSVGGVAVNDYKLGDGDVSL